MFGSKLCHVGWKGRVQNQVEFFVLLSSEGKKEDLSAGAIAKIALQGMREAGVPEPFKAQSIRAAAASAAIDNGASVQNGSGARSVVFRINV